MSITREMLIVELANVTQLLEAAERVRDQYRDDYSKTLKNNTKLRDENDRLRKNACSCASGPLQERTQLEQRNKELQQIVNSLQTNLVEVTKQRDAAIDGANANASTAATALELVDQATQQTRWRELVSERNKLHTVTMEQSDEIAMLHGTIRELRANSKRIGELQAESDKNAKAAQLAEQEVRVLRGKSEYMHVLMLEAEIKQLKASQCQCVPVLEEKIKGLEANLREQHQNQLDLIEQRDAVLSQLPDGMKHCTIRFKQCENGHGMLTATNWTEHPCPWCKIAKLRELFKEGMHSNEMYQSNPPKNVVAYRGLEILDEGE